MDAARPDVAKRDSEDVERQIAEHLVRRDFTAAGTLALRAYGPEVLGLLVTILRDERAAGEAFSQFSEDLWVGLPGFRGASSFRTWTYALAHHAAYRWKRDPYHRRAVGADECPEVLDVAAQVRTTTLSYLRTDVKDRVRRLREHLDTDEQMLLVLRVDRGLAWDEIVTVLFGPSGEELDPKARARHAASLRKRFERIKERLRAAVARDPSLRRSPDAT
ncbi:MAG TPA: sigma factor [Polyangiaceae bacterium]|jgi:RNA polymerase sigma-70 factor (ECF subfamily)